MKNILTTALLILILFFTGSAFYAQKLKPSESGYASVNGTKTYYEVYGQGRPVILLHGGFVTIDVNWGQLIRNFQKTEKSLPWNSRGTGIHHFQRESFHTQPWQVMWKQLWIN